MSPTSSGIRVPHVAVRELHFGREVNRIVGTVP